MFFSVPSCLRFNVSVFNHRIVSRQIIATENTTDVGPPKGSEIGREMGHLFQGTLGWRNIIIWPDSVLRGSGYLVTGFL